MKNLQRQTRMIRIDDKKFIQDLNKYFKNIKNPEAKELLENSFKFASNDFTLES